MTNNATRMLLPLVLALGLLAPVSAVLAQAATEIYIPIGQSPGLSGKYTVIGHIREIDRVNGTITVVGRSRSWKVKLTDDTRIWLDCSIARESNRVGTPTDCRQSLLCEVKFEGRLEPASIDCDWIKVRPAAPQHRPRRN